MNEAQRQAIGAYRRVLATVPGWFLQRLRDAAAGGALPSDGDVLAAWRAECAFRLETPAKPGPADGGESPAGRHRQAEPVPAKATGRRPLPTLKGLQGKRTGPGR